MPKVGIEPSSPAGCVLSTPSGGQVISLQIFYVGADGDEIANYEVTELLQSPTLTESGGYSVPMIITGTCLDPSGLIRKVRKKEHARGKRTILECSRFPTFLIRPNRPKWVPVINNIHSPHHGRSALLGSRS